MHHEEKLILVDKHDAQVGTLEKLETHRRGLLHRAFSIFVANEKGEILLQKRAAGKYHSGGLWTNTCCGHPRDGEELLAAAHRRLKEEMGFDCPLKEISSLIYKVNLDHGLTEHELLHIFSGTYNDVPVINPDEASGWRWATLDAITADVATYPDAYTAWFKIILKKAAQEGLPLI